MKSLKFNAQDKVKVIANDEHLNSIGIVHENLRELEGIVLRDYEDGFLEICFIESPVPIKFDIMYHMLEKK